MRCRPAQVRFFDIPATWRQHGKRPSATLVTAAVWGLVSAPCAWSDEAGAKTRAAVAGVEWRGAIEVASGDAYQGPWRMNRSRFYYVDDPAVDIAGDGGIGVAWVDNRAQNVLFQKLDGRSGRPVGAPVDVSRSPGTFSWLPKVAMSADGGSVFVLWQEIVFSGGSHGGETFFSRSTDGGRTFSDPLNLSRSLAGDGKGRLTRERWHNGSLDLALGPDGTLYTAWTEYEGALWFRRSTDGGRTFEAAARVGGSDDKPARGPDIAVGPDGTVYLAWAVGEDPEADIHLAASADGGRSFGEPRVILPGEGHSDAPQIAAGEDGALHIVYAESPPGMFGQYHVRYARLGPGGEVARGAGRISGLPSDALRSEHFPSLAVRGETVYAVWERFPAGERRPRGLGFAISTDHGGTFSAPAVVPGSDDRALGANGGRQGLLMQKIAVNESGDIAVVNSRFDAGEASRIRLIRGRAAR